ncbi:nucleolar transcription factor 1-like [Notolabrus celidotus]|uniref:nucleolar transcription factor 1-like n=1 Tax=Notolabrus celidotus TaxID=1203425 RepID=UPI0014900AB8|nr:nucleolar transcription factor 1-like [Notolabrus celidotus]
MSESIDLTYEPEWTQENLQRLLDSLRNSIPAHEIFSIYHKGLRTVDWNKVAFTPFSPVACCDKWTEILQKMRKIKTLTELIDEAEDALYDPMENNRCKKIPPVHPKRPPKPNVIFYEENWTKYHEKNPYMDSQQLCEALSKKYQKLSDEQKAPYLEKYMLGIEDFWKKMNAFRKKVNPPPSSRRKRVSAGEDEDSMPQEPPVDVYSLFCTEQRRLMPADHGKNQEQMWSQKWRALTEEQREEYRDSHRELRKEYLVKLNEYLVSSNDKERKRVVGKRGTKRPKLTGTMNRFQDEPKIPPRTGYVTFFEEQMELLKEEFPNSSEHSGEVGKMWRDLSITEKKSYEQRVQQNMTKYSKELQKWFGNLTSAEQKVFLSGNPNKKQYLDAELPEVHDRDNHPKHRTLDSEDIESSSSGEVVYSEGEELEGDGEGDMFEMF